MEKEWFVYFEFIHEGKVYKYKKREGINYYKNIDDRWNAASKLLDEIEYALVSGWNPVTDKGRRNIVPQFRPTTEHAANKNTTRLTRIQRLYIELLNS